MQFVGHPGRPTARVENTKDIVAAPLETRLSAVRSIAWLGAFRNDIGNRIWIFAAQIRKTLIRQHSVSKRRASVENRLAMQRKRCRQMLVIVGEKVRSEEALKCIRDSHGFKIDNEGVCGRF